MAAAIALAAVSTMPGSGGALAAQPGADLAVAKVVSNPKPNVGDTVTFTVTLTNASPVTATNVEVTDLLPAGLSFVFAVPSQGTFNPASGLWVVGAVTSTTPQTLQVAATVVSPKTRKNKAKISHADQVDPHKSNNSASATVAPQQADLGLAKTVSDSKPNVGDAVAFTVTLSNKEPDAATNVQVSDLLPAGLSFVSATPSQGVYDPGSGLWTVGTVFSTTPQTLQLTATVVSAGARTNTAVISHADQFDRRTHNNVASATETPQQADLAIAKRVDDPTPLVGDAVTFTVALSNNGPSAATSVGVFDLLPAGLVFVSGKPSQGTYSFGSGLWTVGTVKKKKTVTLRVVATVVSPGAQTNTATVIGADQFDPNVLNNAASAIVVPQ